MRLFFILILSVSCCWGVVSCKNEVTACFSAPQTAPARQVVIINSCATYGRGELKMNFGDGSPQQDFNPLTDTISHIYTNTGSFRLTMQAAYKNNSHSLTKTIHILP